MTLMTLRRPCLQLPCHFSPRKCFGFSCVELGLCHLLKGFWMIQSLWNFSQGSPELNPSGFWKTWFGAEGSELLGSLETRPIILRSPWEGTGTH